ncbi:MAG: type III pantothenate kinase [Candidatus Zixiibacteriota bacterium]
MLLAIDIGNTNTVVGVYDSAALKGSFRVASQHHMTSDEAGFFVMGLLDRMQVDLSAVMKVVIGSVVPPLTSTFEEMSRKFLKCHPITVSARIKLPVRIEIDRPDEVGADRIANAAAGWHRFGGPVIVVDFGTATTFDVVSKEGAYIGGVIIPGPETSMAELARKAARLFEIRIEPPDRVVGKSTAGALKSGLFYGTIGQVDYIIERIKAETGFDGCTVIATGGLSAGLEKHSRYIKSVDPNLTLDGLRLIAEMN